MKENAINLMPFARWHSSCFHIISCSSHISKKKVVEMAHKFSLLTPASLSAVLCLWCWYELMLLQRIQGRLLWMTLWHFCSLVIPKKLPRIAHKYRRVIIEETIFYGLRFYCDVKDGSFLWFCLHIFFYVVVPQHFTCSILNDEKNIFVLWICISCHHYLNIYVKLFALRPLMMMLLLLFVH